MGRLSTNHCNSGHTKTVALPRKDTSAGLVSTNARLWLTYPMETKDPPNRTSRRREGLRRKRKGERTSEARTMREEVAAEAGRASFMREPRGKLVA
mmetsp:Transcript_11551/g.24352  ORF Transcript_11551/g.24352 Transcript_11551/m.24352 type:complete len:96 (-) Transcript_11551:635-922(-)